MNGKLILIGTIVFSALTVFGQQSGNQVIGKYYNYNEVEHTPTINRLYLSDTAFVVQANVLINAIADTYVATFGVAESAATLKDANTKMDERIQKFVSALLNLGIAERDIYVDMTTQTQISDYKVKGDYAEQFISGFEQKKNVIIKFKDIKDLDKMIIIASDHGIYDLAKVDYVVTDINKIYTELFQTAMEVINSKKDLFVKATNIKLTTSSQIFGESFYSLAPQQLYKSYTPNISAEYFDYGYGDKRKNLRNSTTYYYDHIDYSGFDKVLNPIVTEPAVEYMLMLQIKFNIEKGK